MYEFAQPTLNKQAPRRLKTQKSMRCSCFPPEVSTLEQLPPVEIEREPEKRVTYVIS